MILAVLNLVGFSKKEFLPYLVLPYLGCIALVICLFFVKAIFLLTYK
jgi:hypothetical protein